MAIKYRMYQSTREGKFKNYWYARPVVDTTIGVRALAERISDRCTVTESDILAVISALVKELAYELKSGRRVKLDGLGAFKPSFHCMGCKERKDFVVAKNIRSTHVIFQPETHKSGPHTMSKYLLEGAKLEEVTAVKPEDKGKAEPALP
ncbi:HU family DNA-binding protein [Prevotella dentasini]